MANVTLSLYDPGAQKHYPIVLVDNGDSTYSVQMAVSVPVTATLGAFTVADGADVAEGTTTDVAVQGDTAGTVLAKLRGLNKAIGATTDTASSTTLLGYLLKLIALLPGLGQKTMANSQGVVIASDQSPLTAVRTATMSAPTFTVTASAYTAGNCLGGLLTLTGAMRISSGSGLLQSLTLTDHGNQKAPLDIYIFNALPSGTFTGQVAYPTLTTLDNAKIVARISILTTEWVTTGGGAYVCKNNLGILVKASGSTNLYAAMATSGTPTPVGTTDMTIAFGFVTN